MPNWCNNTVEITHEDPAMIQRVIKGFTAGELLNEFLPIPEELKIVAGRAGEDGSPEQVLLEAQQKANRDKFGHDNWYNWCVANWGTKWDVGGDDCAEVSQNGNRLTMSFDSAWAPPCAAYEALMDMGFEIRAYYSEPGMGFAGIWDNGSDDFYELGGMNSTQLAEELPEELDEMFGISESAAEYEAENEEEENENE